MIASIRRDPARAQEVLEQRHEEVADHALEVLGSLRGGAMKLGQLASFVDADLLPPEFRAVYQERLAGLRDAAPPMSWGKIESVLESEWEAPVESLFEDFEQDAAAAASIGQVHRARLPDGRAVAVKVQYPEVADALVADLGTGPSTRSVVSTPTLIPATTGCARTGGWRSSTSATSRWSTRSGGRARTGWSGPSWNATRRSS